METKELPPHIQLRNELAKASTAQQSVAKPLSKKRNTKYHERWIHFNRLIDFEQRHLTDSEFRVLLTLFRDARHGITQTAQSDLATRTGKCRGTIVRAIKKLVQKGLIEVARQGGLIGPEAVDDFYSDMTAKKNWSKFEGYSRVSTWLGIYFFSFFRNAWNKGIKDQEDNVASQNTDQESPRKHKSRDRRFQALSEDHSDCNDSDPQTAMLRSSIGKIAKECFSIFSPNDLQFICQLRACRRNEITQKEIAEQLKIDESTLTRRKQQLHKRFTERFLALFKQAYPSIEIQKKDVTLAPEDDWEGEKDICANNK